MDASPHWSDLLEQLLQGRPLSPDQAAGLMRGWLAGAIDGPMTGALLAALRARGVGGGELAAMAAPYQLPVLLVNEQQSSRQARAVIKGAAAYDVTPPERLPPGLLAGLRLPSSQQAGGPSQRAARPGNSAGSQAAAPARPVGRLQPAAHVSQPSTLRWQQQQHLICNVDLSSSALTAGRT